MIAGYLQTALVFFVVFTVLIFFHELGHFLTAKFFRMKVHEFGFGLPLPFTKRLCRYAFDGETEYTIWPFLMGGFVRIAGMEIDAEGNKATDETESARPHEALGTTNIQAMRQETAEVDGAQPDGFNSRPIYQRFAVILAGPVFSFLLGWLAFCAIGVTTGMPDKTRLTVQADPKPASIAYQAGLRAGDGITGIGGQPVDSAEKVLDAIHESAGKPLVLTLRNKEGQSRTVTVTPKSETVAGESKPIGRIGFVPDIEPITYRRMPIGESFANGNALLGRWFQTMTLLVSSGAIKDSVGGPVAIVRETHNAAQHGGTATLGLLGQLSLSLALSNLLPIPVLDGGHLSLMLVEAVRRRKLTAEQQSRVLVTGFAILAVLFVLVMFKDITGLFKRG